MKRILIFIYGIFAYLIFVGTVLYAIAFFNNSIVPTGIDKGGTSSLLETMVVNLGLIALFGIVHSVMARREFKRWWTRIIPKAAERSTYLVQAGLLLILIMWQWRPLPAVIWSVEGDFARIGVQALHLWGWIMVVLSTFLINHFHFSGLQQVFENLRGKEVSRQKFVTPLFYKVIRHPLLLGLLIAFWVTADMTVGRLLFATTMTIYILIGVHFEERDLVQEFGSDYVAYRKRTPKLLPKIPVSI
jgi:protein-S-isoprenylcysteine O-methyltransferase Ste14